MNGSPTTTNDELIEILADGLLCGPNRCLGYAPNACKCALAAERLKEALGKLDRYRSAAQEMLEALQCVLENEASDHKAQEEFGGYVLDDDVRRVVIAAIAKATGAAPENDSPTTQRRID